MLQAKALGLDQFSKKACKIGGLVRFQVCFASPSD